MTRYAFAGLTEEHELPPAYDDMMDRHGANKVGSLIDVIRKLRTNYPADIRMLSFQTEAEGKSHRRADNYHAIVNPEWEGRTSDEIPGDRTDPVWYIPTTGYTLVEHHDVLEPLSDAIDRLDAEAIFGTLRTRRDGGEIHLDVFFHDANIDGADDESITLGISTGNDYMQNVKMYVDAIAFLRGATHDGRVMRSLTDKRSRKHTGAAYDDIVTFYETGVEQLTEVGDELRNVIANAMHYEFPTEEMPLNTASFFRYLELPDREPNTVATDAGDAAARLIPDGVTPTAWHLYKAGMHALENSYEPRDTRAFKKHLSTVNEILFNPALAEKRALSGVEKELVESATDPDTELTEFTEEGETVEDRLDTVRTRAKSISDGVEEFENVRDRITALLSDDGTEEAVDPDTDPEADTDATEESEESPEITAD